MPQTEPNIVQGSKAKGASSPGSDQTPPPREARGWLYWLSYARSILLTNNLIYLYTAVLTVISVAGSQFNRRGHWQHSCARLWGRLILLTGGVRVRVEGLENVDRNAPVIYCSNHPSAMDIPILLAKLPVSFRFLAKRELFHYPFLGWYLRRAGHIAVERGRPRESIRSIEEAAARIREGTPVVLFPEGHRSRVGGEVLPFKTGSFYLAVRAGVPIVPITINGSRYVHEPDTLHVRPGRAEVIIHPPVATAGMTADDVNALCRRVRDVIVSRFIPGKL